MKNIFLKISNYFNKLSFTFKTSFLIFISSSGMIAIILLSQISIFSLKDDFDKLFYIKTTSLIKLENLKDIYQINIQETIKDYIKGDITITQANEVLNLAKQLISKNWDFYLNTINEQYTNLFISFFKLLIKDETNILKNEVLQNNLIENINNKMYSISQCIKDIKDKKDYSQMYLDINSISIYLNSLIHYDLSRTNLQKHYKDKLFRLVIIFSIISIFIIFIFSILLSVLIINHFKTLHNSLEEKVQDKTKELKEINNYLEIKINKEVEYSRKKDIIMIHQARLASLGEMLNNIAHQWRQPLGSITMIIQSFKTKKNLGKLTDIFVEDKVKDALLLANNMSNTLDDFKNFFSPDRKKSIFFIKNCIKHSLELAKYTIEKENISIKIDIKDDIQINSYYNELSHVFLNIISNAKDALISNNIKNKYIVIKKRKEYNYAIIELIDNAGGIPEDISHKIFEPYYTTKYKSAGTGIGLYMSKQIVEKHIKGILKHTNIEYSIDSINYQCSKFSIKIPLSKERNNE